MKKQKEKELRKIDVIGIYGLCKICGVIECEVIDNPKAYSFECGHFEWKEGSEGTIKEIENDIIFIRNCEEEYVSKHKETIDRLNNLLKKLKEWESFKHGKK